MPSICHQGLSFIFPHSLWPKKGSRLDNVMSTGQLNTVALKTIATMPSQNTEFSYFLTIDTREYELPNYLLKIGGHRPLKGRYDVICNDIIFHLMVNNSKTLGFQRVV